MSAGPIAGGLVLIITAGVFNGSWNAAFSPKANLAVGKIVTKEAENGTKEDTTSGELSSSSSGSGDLSYHHSFGLFQIYATIINIPICIFWAGGFERVNSILKEVSASSIVLVILFSFIWGFGTLLFGLACKIAGVGLGTNLSMGVVAVIGTFLPLIIESMLFSVAGLVICIGLIICCFGLYLSTKALSMKDNDELNYYDRTDRDASDIHKGVDTMENGEHDAAFSNEHSNDKDKNDSNSTQPQGKGNNTRQSSSSEELQTPTWKKIFICLATGICAAQLQFAFIFGKRITDLALGDDKASSSIPGTTPKSGGAAIIWLFAISVGAPISILNALYSSPVPLSSACKAPLSRHFKVILTTSLPWVSHIHIYGLCATTLLPKKVAASVGWPMLMMVTTGQALILSVYLGEWKLASKETISTLKKSIVTTLIGIFILMCSVAAPTENALSK